MFLPHSSAVRGVSMKNGGHIHVSHLLRAGLSLYGVQLQCSAAAGAARKPRPKQAQRSAFLFTHRGYSGPAVLDLSHALTMAQERGMPAPGRHVSVLCFLDVKFKPACQLHRYNVSIVCMSLQVNWISFTLRKAILTCAVRCKID